MRAQCWNLEGPLRPIKSLTKSLTFMKKLSELKISCESNEFEEKLFRVKSNAQQIFLKEQIFSIEHIFLKEQEKSNFLEGTNLLEETNLLTLFYHSWCTAHNLFWKLTPYCFSNKLIFLKKLIFWKELFTKVNLHGRKIFMEEKSSCKKNLHGRKIFMQLEKIFSFQTACF